MNRTVLAGRALAALTVLVSLTACSGADGGAGAYTVPPGGSGEVELGGSMLTLSIRSLECGPQARAQISEKVAYNRDRLGDAPAEWLTSLPDGSQFCVLTLEVTNTGGEPVAWSLQDAPVSLNVGERRYESLGQARQLSQDFSEWARARSVMLPRPVA